MSPQGCPKADRSVFLRSAVIGMGPYEFGALPSAEWMDLGGALQPGTDASNPTPRLAGFTAGNGLVGTTP